MDKFTNSFAGVGPNKPSPVRIRREIVAGAYGIVTIANSLDVKGEVYVFLNNPARNAEELREAAHIFNQIAEALEDNAK